MSRAHYSTLLYSFPTLVVAKAIDKDLTKFVNTKLYLYYFYKIVYDNL
jgi:hypothetical protein